MAQLDYLLFDPSEEESGACSFDALASALPARLAPLLQEVADVLAWAHGAFGAPSAGDGEGEWAFELQATDERETPLAITFDLAHRRVSLPQPPAGRVTIALTLSGSRAFADGFRDAFPAAD